MFFGFVVVVFGLLVVFDLVVFGFSSFSTLSVVFVVFLVVFFGTSFSSFSAFVVVFFLVVVFFVSAFSFLAVVLVLVFFFVVDVFLDVPLASDFFVFVVLRFGFS